MSEALIEHDIRQAYRPSFFFWMTVVMAVFIFGGFGLTYWQPMATGALPPLPPIVHLHGFFYSCWMILLLVQAFLINVKRVPLHRSVGTFGIAAAAALLVTGALITLLFGNFSRSNPPADYYDLMYLSVMALVSFGTLFTLAIRQVRRPENHKRLMLFAAIPLLPPGINRLYMASLGLTDLPVLATYLTMDFLAAAILVHDWRTMGRISKASLVGAGLILLQQLLHGPVAGSDAFAGFSHLLTDLVYYR